MGYYTQLVLSLNLEKDTPDEVIRLLQYLVKIKEDDYDLPLPVHEFFACERWDDLFTSGSYSFDGISVAKLERDNVTEEYELSSVHSQKTYDNEYRLFMEWLAPYIHYRYTESVYSLLGWMQAESRINLTHIYLTEDKKIRYYDVDMLDVAGKMNEELWVT